MDKAIYALRDVTATVSSVPLMASSIMSKKIAAGADKIIIDIKTGEGALLQKKEDAKELKRLMIEIGKIYNREVKCIISDMNTPLGYAVGNSLEVLEAIDVLKGVDKESNFYDLCIKIATDMVSMGLEISSEEAEKKVEEVINNKKAYNRFLEIIKYQGGDINTIKVSPKTIRIKSKKSGIVKDIVTLEVGKLSVELGAGRKNIDDKIDHTVGIILNKTVGDKVKKGELLMTLYVNKTVPKVDIDKIFTID